MVKAAVTCSPLYSFCVSAGPQAPSAPIRGYNLVFQNCNHQCLVSSACPTDCDVVLWLLACSSESDQERWVICCSEYYKSLCQHETHDHTPMYHTTFMAQWTATAEITWLRTAHSFTPPSFQQLHDLSLSRYTPSQLLAFLPLCCIAQRTTTWLATPSSFTPCCVMPTAAGQPRPARCQHSDNDQHREPTGHLTSSFECDH
jgi:hypothetical protein